MVHHNDRAAVFRQQTNKLIHASLSDDWEENELQLPGGNSPLIANFSTVGRAIAESSSSGKETCLRSLHPRKIGHLFRRPERKIS